MLSVLLLFVQYLALAGAMGSWCWVSSWLWIYLTLYQPM